jgi:lipopolysaccharide export system ATP-binding protein
MLIAKDLCKTYNERLIVNNVTLQFDRGEIVGILGPNGSGKTTCFYMLVGIVKPDSGGTIMLNNSDITSLPVYVRAQMGLGYLPQESSVFHNMSTEDNIAALLEIYMPDKARRKAKIDSLLNEFQLTHVAKTKARALSGGERRRLEIARLLSINPQYVLLDEPFAGVDPIAIRDTCNIISAIKASGIGVLITDHNVRETLKIIDRAYVLHDGKVLCSGSRDEMMRHKSVQEVYLGTNF